MKPSEPPVFKQSVSWCDRKENFDPSLAGKALTAAQPLAPQQVHSMALHPPIKKRIPSQVPPPPPRYHQSILRTPSGFSSYPSNLSPILNLTGGTNVLAHRQSAVSTPFVSHAFASQKPSPTAAMLRSTSDVSSFATATGLTPVMPTPADLSRCASTCSTSSNMESLLIACGLVSEYQETPAALAKTVVNCIEMKRKGGTLAAELAPLSTPGVTATPAPTTHERSGGDTPRHPETPYNIPHQYPPHDIYINSYSRNPHSISFKKSPEFTVSTTDEATPEISPLQDTNNSPTTSKSGPRDPNNIVVPVACANPTTTKPSKGSTFQIPRKKAPREIMNKGRKLPHNRTPLPRAVAQVTSPTVVHVAKKAKLSKPKVQFASISFNPQWCDKVQRCRCKKNRCLKLYCDCFASSELCGLVCRCVGCGNQLYESTERKKAIRHVLSKYHGKFGDNRMTRKERKEALFRDGPGKKNCGCKKTRCLKKYCECFLVGAYCAADCNCQTCENYPGGKVDKLREAT